MFRSYRPSVKHLYTIRIAYTTCRNNSESIFRTQNNQKKNCARLRIFALGLRIFCARLRFSFSPKWPKSARKCSKCRPNWVSESVRIGCPNSVSESVRIGCPNWVSYRYGFKKVPASCMPCPGKRTFKITNYILLCSESRFLVRTWLWTMSPENVALLSLGWYLKNFEDIEKFCIRPCILQWQPFKPLKVWRVFSNMW